MNKKIFLFFYLFLSSLIGVHTYAQVITTIAGDSVQGYNGDNIAATTAKLYGPYSTAVDTAGNLYIADLDNNRVRKVNTAGIITTIAGNGVAGYSGDDSAATLAKLDGPAGVAVDASGNVYIADDYNSRIRKVNTSGIITTIAGTGVNGYSGDNGPSTAAEINDPHGIAVDAIGNVYICDELNSRVRIINIMGIITTIAGTGLPGYSGDNTEATSAEIDHPYGVAVDLTGNIYFTEWTNNCVRKINTAGIITTIAGGNPTLGFSGDKGPATAADFHIPIGIAIDKAGNIFIGDSYNNRVRKIDQTGIITTYAGTGLEGYSGDNGPAIDAELYGPIGITVDISDNLYIADYSNGRIRYIKSTVDVPVTNFNSDTFVSYPNPNMGSFVTKIISATNEPAYITITNLVGQTIQKFSTNTNESISIHLNEPDGVYIIIAVTTHVRLTDKLVINKFI
jgi:sugar lactone lactonase YvrE